MMAFIFGLVSFSGNILMGQAVTQKKDIRIPSHNGIYLSANTFTPESQDDRKRFPGIILINSWAMSEHEYYFKAKKLAKQGYLVLSYSSRGWGKSEGMVEGGGPKDVADLKAVIDWLLNHTSVIPNRIGVVGISYGAGIALLGAAQDKRLRTVVSLSGWSDLIASLYPNQTPNRSWSKMLIYSGEYTGRLNPELWYFYKSLMKHSNIDKMRSWARVRSPGFYVEKINKNHIPIYFSHNTSDYLFPSTDILSLFERLTVPKRLDMNNGVHAMAELPGLLGLTTYSWKQVDRWLAYWLRDEKNEVMSESQARWQLRNRPQMRVEDNDLRSEALQFRLSPSKMMAGKKGKPSFLKINSQWDTYATTGIPVLSSVMDASRFWLVKLALDYINRKFGIALISQPIEKKATILGSPILQFKLTPDSRKMQLIAYLYVVDESNIGTLMSHIPLTLHHCQPGEALEVELKFHATAFAIAPGHRLGVVLDTQDPLYQILPSHHFNVTFETVKTKPLLSVPVQ